MFPDRERSDETPEAMVRCPLPSAPAATPTAAAQHCSDMSRICITVAPFTGGPFEVSVSKGDTVEELKKLIARRLKVSKERIYLLYRESELVEGSVGANLLVDGSTVTLLPRAETGLISPKPEQSVMQALESLNEQQVNDFLSGAAPLNLTMRLGDHMMLIQLQLSTLNQLNSSRHRASKSSIQISNPRPSSHTYTPSSSSRSNPLPSSSRSHPSRGATSTPLHSTSTPRPTTTYSPLPSTSHLPSTSSSSSLYTSPPSTSSTSSKKVRLPLLSPGGLHYAAPPGGAQPPVTAAPQEEPCGEPSAKKPRLDTKALAEASKNLTQTLKQLSSEVLTKPSQPPKQQQQPQQTKPKKEEKSSRKRRAATDSRGAIIESMHHHGKGVYSGTFSGTLNPALQDANGQPKRDITTIVHILNDLLCAQYKAYSSGSRSKNKDKNHHHHQKQTFGSEPADQSERELSEQQLNITRTKMEALKRIMEERRAKREARRQAQSRPYSTAWSVQSESKTVVVDAVEDNETFLQVEPEPVTA